MSIVHAKVIHIGAEFETNVRRFDLLNVSLPEA